MRIAFLPAFSGLLLVAAADLNGEIRPMTLKQAVDTALKQNADVTLARIAQQKAGEAVREARDPFSTKLRVGSGLAYSSGFPLSIEGSAPSVVRADASQSLLNRSQSYLVAAARERERGTAIDLQAKREEITYRTASLYLDAERARRGMQSTLSQVASLERAAAVVAARVAEGRELELEAKRAALRLAQARQRVLVLDGQADWAEMSLAVLLGFAATDRVRPSGEARKASLNLPETEAVAVEAALANSKELRKLESEMQAKGLEKRSALAQRSPQINLVAQYGLFARYNNYEDFFRKFQRHNGQLGVSIQVPLFAGGAVKAQAQAAELDVLRLRTEVARTRERISADVRRQWREVAQTAQGKDVAKLDLEVTLEQLSILVAQMEEGRSGMRQVEEARAAEGEKWAAFYEAQYVWERAQLNLLRETGRLVEALD